MTAELALLGVVLGPLAQALLTVILARPPGMRDVVFVSLSLFTAACAWRLLQAAAAGEAARIALVQPLPNVDLALAVEPFAALTAAVIAVCSVLHALHTVGLMRVTREPAPVRLMVFIALCVGAVMAVAFSANLFTLFVANQALTLAAFPLVAHRGDAESAAAGRLFLATLLAASVGLFLPAMVWTYAIVGALDFQTGGVLAGRVDALTANALLVMFVVGLATTALPPLHRWLPAAAIAPPPALTTVQALAVVPAGGIGVFKVAAFVFGPALHEAAFATRSLIAVAGVGMCGAALIALSRQDMRERLAYSCIAQSLAVLLAVLLALPVGLFAGALQLTATIFASATLSMVVGSVAAVTTRQSAGDYTGLGRVMPWSLAAFALACASMIGMPPFSGAWAKLWLITGAASAGLTWAAALVGLAAILTFAHLGPLAANALAARAPPDPFHRPDGASIALVAPVVLSAAATLWLLIAADPLAAFLAPVWTPQP
ncbi:MAG: hypothetical protein JNM59_11485 [Hyphomonadaceae bacterium]|nr:hypothetical protein [Hyphomonadaceae bacterium]